MRVGRIHTGIGMGGVYKWDWFVENAVKRMGSGTEHIQDFDKTISGIGWNGSGLGEGYSALCIYVYYLLHV